MLEKLALKDKKWRSYALHLTKNKQDADDLIQDMYLKFADLEKDNVSDAYFLIAIRNTFYNNQKKKKYEYCYDEFNLFNLHEEKKQLDDNEKKIVDFIKNNVNWWEEELLEMKYHHSYRELAKMYNLNYGFVFKTISNIKDNLKKELSYG